MSGARHGSFWRETARRFRRSPPALAAASAIGLLVLLACCAPFIAGTRPIICRYKGATYFPFLQYYYAGGQNAVFFREGFRNDFRNGLKKDPASWAIWPLFHQDPYDRVQRGQRGESSPGDASFEPPSPRHLLGTDQAGLDVFTRVLYGTRTALLVGFLSMALAGVLGILLGALAGYFGGWIDIAISRLIEVLLAVPTLVLILALLSILEKPGIHHLVIVIGLTRWETIARYMRGEVIRLKEREFVLAARALGARWPRLIFRHLLPNALAPVIVTLTFGIANTILLESALSFLGFGVQSPTPSWGSTLREWYSNYERWWLAVYPGLAVFFTVLAYNLTGDALQEAMDPRRAR